jgi:hypothetical protein
MKKEDDLFDLNLKLVCIPWRISRLVHLHGSYFFQQSVSAPATVQSTQKRDFFKKKIKDRDEIKLLYTAA